jgi:energy-coupling factor transport system permease protein
VVAAWRYRPGRTWVYRLDPRVKVLTLIIPVIIATQVSDIRVMTILLIAGAWYYLSARIPRREIGGIWTFFTIFVLVLVSLNALVFTGGGQFGVVSRRLASWPWVSINTHFPFLHPSTYHLTAAVLLYVLTQAMRLYAIAVYAFSFPFIVDPADLGVAFRRLGLPDKLAFATDMAFRFVPVLGRELQTTIDAQRVRGYELDRVRGGPIARAVRIAPVVVPVVLNAILGAEDIIDAMDLRGFGTGKRTWLRNLVYSTLDWVALAVMVVGLVAATVANLTGHLGVWYPPGWE